MAAATFFRPSARRRPIAAAALLAVAIAGAAEVAASAAPTAAAAPDRSAQGQLVDGIAALVDGEVITIAEVRRAALMLRETGTRPAGGCGGLGAEAVGFGATPRADAAREPDAEELEAARECLIDGALVFREARRFPQLDVTRAQVNEAYQRLQDAFPDADAFRRELVRFGLTPEGVRRDLRRQLLVAAYVDSRFRATVDVDDSEARDYYQQQLVPGMRERGIEPPPYEDVADDYVLPILRQREVNRRVESWLEDLHARAEIRRLYPGGSSRQ